VTVELDDDIVDINQLEEAALAFGRAAPAQLVASTIESMMAELVTTVIGPPGLPLPDTDQLTAPWECTGCRSRQGFRRRGAASKPRRLATACGRVAFRSQAVQCQACQRRFSPAPQLLGLAVNQRRSDGLSRMAAGLAVEVAYAKAERLLGEIAGQHLSARTIRRDVLAMAPRQIRPDGPIDVPILLLDGTGERAGQSKGGVELHLAIGLIARRTEGGRVRVKARLLAATLDEPWSVMDGLLAQVTPGLVVVDGEEALSDLAGRVWPDVAVQRCLFHLARATGWLARYKDRLTGATADDLVARLQTLLFKAYRHGDAARARAAYRSLIVHARDVGAYKTAGHLHAAQHEALTFLYRPDAGRLVFGDKGRPELGSGVLERVMREMNRRTDNGVRWSIEGLRRLLMLKLQHKYHHGPWSPTVTSTTPQPVRFSLAA
jgi:transposase-like protein